MGDVLLTYEDGPTAITDIDTQHAERTVHNLHVEETNTYAVGENGILAHNASRECDGLDVVAPRRSISELAAEFATLERGDFRTWKKGLQDLGYDAQEISDAITKARFDVARTCGTKIGGGTTRRSLTKSPGPQHHAHHLVQKRGGGDAAAENRRILEEVGINPLLGRENFTWAPHPVKGQHGKGPQGQLLAMLREVRGNKAGVISVLEK